MRNALFCVSLLFTLCSALAAQDIEIGDNYYFTSFGGSPKAEEGLQQVEGELHPSAQIKVGHRIKVTYVDDDRVYFKYWRFGNRDFQGAQQGESPRARRRSNRRMNEARLGDTLRNIYNYSSGSSIPTVVRRFSLPRNVFEEITNPLYDVGRGFRFGAYTVPIRLRFNNSGGSGEESSNEFDANLTLSANVLYRIGLRKFEHRYVDLLGGVGLTKANLNAENSDLGDPDSEAFADVDVLSPTAFTLSFGGIFNLAESVNIGTYVGWDWLSSADQKANWDFHGKGWLGIGINVSFGTGNDNNNQADGQNVSAGSSPE